MKKLFLIYSMAVFLPHLAISQSYFIKFFADLSNGGAGKLRLNADSNLVFTGNTFESAPGQILQGATVIVLDTLGNLQFQNRLYGTETVIEPPVVNIAGDGFLFSGAIPQIHGLLVKADTVGNIVFAVGYGDSLNWTVTKAACQLASGNIISMGYNRDFADDNFDVTLTRFNSEGTLISGKRIDIGAHDIATNMLMMKSGKLLIAGITDEIPGGESQLFIIEVDTQMNIIQSKNYSTELGIHEVIDVSQMEDSSLCLLVLGWDSLINEPTTNILRIDNNLNPQWLFRVTANELFRATGLKMKGNTILLAGNLETETDSGKITNGSVTELNIDGEILWSKKLKLYNNNLLTGVEAIGNTLFLSGSVTVDPLQNRYYFVSKSFAGNVLGCEEEEYQSLFTEYLSITGNDVEQTNISFGKAYPAEWNKAISGTFSNYCSDNSVNEMETDNRSIVFPVPSNNKISFDFSKFNPKPSSITIYNMLGYEVSHLHLLQLPLPISVSDIGSNGVYLYTANFVDGNILRGKFLIQR
ncbi:MAG: T9SS type A sorting domain-containing protein [Chitinophagales bacterium]